MDQTTQQAIAANQDAMIAARAAIDARRDEIILGAIGDDDHLDLTPAIRMQLAALDTEMAELAQHELRVLDTMMASGHVIGPKTLLATRVMFGLSAEGFARLFRIGSARTVRRWEDGDAEIPGPVQVLVHALATSEAVRSHFGVKSVLQVPYAT